MFSELLRVTRPDGVIRITDNDILHRSNSLALTQLDEIAICALHRAGHLFTQEGTGLTAHLARLLQQHGCQQVQTQPYALEFQAGTEAGQAYYEDMAHVFQTTRPFIQKWAALRQAMTPSISAPCKKCNNPTFTPPGTCSLPGAVPQLKET